MDPSTLAWKSRYSLIYCYSFFTIGNIILSIGPLIPIKAVDSQQLETDFSIIFTFRGIGYIVGTVIISKLQKIFGAHHILSVSFLFQGIICFLSINETRIWLCVIEWLILGFTFSMVEVLAQISLTLVQKDNLNPWMQALHFAFGIGAFISPLLIATIGKSAMIVLGFLALLASLLFFREVSPKHIIQSENSASLQLDSNNSQTKKLVPPLMEKAICVFFFLYVGAEINYAGWIPTFSKLKGVTNQQHAGLSSSLFWIGITVGRFLAIPAANKYTVYDQLKFLLTFSCSVMMLSTLMVWLGLLSISVFAGSFLFGLGLSAMFPLAMSIPVSFKYDMTQENTAVFTFASAIGEGLVPIMGGVLMKYVAMEMVFVLSLGLTVLMIVAFRQVAKFRPSGMRDLVDNPQKLLTVV